MIFKLHFINLSVFRVFVRLHPMKRMPSTFLMNNLTKGDNIHRFKSNV